MVVHSKEAQAKNLIMRAWRERWTDVQWGIYIRSVLEPGSEDGALIANCILQQALGGPGPNSLVLSYLMHSIYSQIISSCAVLKSICKYDGFHKPYCLASLLDLLDNIKDHVILNDGDDCETCMEIAQALAATVHWLLTCMYSSLENLSDLSISDVPVDAEDSKIVMKCKNLIDHFLNDSFITGLLHCAVLEKDDMFQNIKKMSGEIAKFSDGHHHQEIAFVTGLVDKIGHLPTLKSSEDLGIQGLRLNGQIVTGGPSIQSTLLTHALSRSSIEVLQVGKNLKIIKEIRDLSNVDLLYQVIHSSLALVVDSLGRSSELDVVGSTIFILPSLLKTLLSLIQGTSTDLVKSVNLFLDNDSILEIIDTKLGCYTLEIILSRFQQNNLISDADKMQLLQLKPQQTLPIANGSNCALLLLKMESLLPQVFTALDGVLDLQKNQDNILTTLTDVIGTNFDYFLTVLSCCGKMKQFVVKLLKVNQGARLANGETDQKSATRASLFDATFLMLTFTAQIYGKESLPLEEGEFFFTNWYNECMLEDSIVKNPDAIYNRCEQASVDMLLNQYLQNDTNSPELKTSLVFWHDMCTNVVGVVRELLYAWEAGSANFQDVKKVLDVLRSKVFSLPVCIAAWLCSHIQVSPEEQSGKAKYILNQFRATLEGTNDDSPSQIQRFALMNKIIGKMSNCVQPPATGTLEASPSTCAVESKPISDLYQNCYTSMESKKRVDVDTYLVLKTLLDVSGSHYFVQGLVSEMMQNQSAYDLRQWSEMLYGVFNLNILDCTAALLRVVIPSLLNYWDRDTNFVEPQILALVSLSVDCIYACYENINSTQDSSAESEPASKRRKIMDSDDKSKKEDDWKFMLGELFEEFQKILTSSPDIRPQAVFVLKFLEQLFVRIPDLSMMMSLPASVIATLMSLMTDEINPQVLLRWYSLTEKASRSRCVEAICALKHMQNVNRHYCGVSVS